MRALALVLPMLALACGPAEMNLGLSDGEGGAFGGNADSDGDGLSDSEEAELGTDPDSADSDDDGYADGEELDGFTDPLDETDHPYAGDYGMDECRWDVESSGNGVGEIATQFELPDQHGDTVRLHDFCGRAVLLEPAAYW